MFRVELGSDDFYRDSGFVKIGNVVHAIARILLENGSPNRFQAERDAWPHIHTGIVMGVLHPQAPETLDLLSINDYGNGVVLFAELVEWGRKTGRFAFVVASPAAKVEAAPVTDTRDDEQTSSNDDVTYDEALAALFDAVPVAALETMFPAGGKWEAWAEKAKAKGLIDAREGRAMFNPYKAGVWFIRRGAKGWDDARLHRTLANNLPGRSRDNAHLLTGDMG